MTYELSEQEKRGVLSSPDEKQYAHFINKVADWGEVWSLNDGERWATLGDPEEGQLFPVWPHPDYAKDAAVDGWQTFRPKAFEVHDFLEHCDRLEQDGQRVAVLHKPNGDYLEMPLRALAEDVQAELDRIE